MLPSSRARAPQIFLWNTRFKDQDSGWRLRRNFPLPHGRLKPMTGKVSVLIEQDEHGCYAWCPELRGCQSQGNTVEEALSNIREAVELFLETLTDEERTAA
jgi:predicted RNase H-like HicB family nuclease